MTNDADRSPFAALITTFELRRNATLGFAAAIVFAAIAYVYRVAGLAGPVPDTRGSPVLFLLLAFVLAITLGVFLTLILTIRTAFRIYRRDTP